MALLDEKKDSLQEYDLDLSAGVTFGMRYEL
jgi:hypothetical protein